MQNYDIDLYAGRAFQISINATDSFGNPINLSGYSSNSIIKSKYSDTTGILSFNTSITLPASGAITMSMSPTGTLSLAPNRYIYDLEVFTLNSGDSISILQGYINVYPTVTDF